MSEELREQITEFIEQVIDLRMQFGIPDFTAGPVELHRALVDVQTTLSKVESFLSKAVRAKAALDRKEIHLRMVWQEAFDTALINKKRTFSGDFVTGKEKAAEANLATLNEARTLRFIQDDQSFANEAVEVIRLHYYGLDKVRQDIRKRLDMSQTDYYS